MNGLVLLLGRLLCRIRAVLVLDCNHFVGALVRRLDGFGVVVGNVMFDVENFWLLSFPRDGAPCVPMIR